MMPGRDGAERKSDRMETEGAWLGGKLHALPEKKVLADELQ
jgi:hypothetical protein